MSTTQSNLSLTESLTGSFHSEILYLIFIEMFCPHSSLERVTQQRNLFLNSPNLFYLLSLWARVKTASKFSSGSLGLPDILCCNVCQIVSGHG